MKEKGGEFVWFDGKLVKWEDAKVPIYTHALMPSPLKYFAKGNVIITV